MPAGRPFKKGNPGGPGRPKRAVEETYLVALKETVTLEQWKKVAKKAIEQALRGDRDARAWLSKYLLPVPENQPPPQGTTPEAVLSAMYELITAKPEE